MTAAHAPTVSDSRPVRPKLAWLAWLRTKDPGFAALRRATRTALIMPALFALGTKAIGDPTLGLFAAFGSFAMLLLVDFQGTIRERLQAQASLGVACCVLICLGTLASHTTWLAALAMAVVAFGVLFAGVVSSVLAGATTALLLAFILPVSLKAPASSIPDCIEGWGMAAGASLLAISLLWPAPAHNPIRGAAIAASRALGARLRAEVAYLLGESTPESEADHVGAVAAADAAVRTMHTVFFATPYRPSGLSTAARAVVRLVDELRWLDAVVLRSAPMGHPRRPNRSVCAVKIAAAATLESAADLLETPSHDSGALGAALERLRPALDDLEQEATLRLPATAAGTCSPTDDRARVVVSSLDPSFRAQELSFIVSQIASNAEYAAAAERRSWAARLLGRRPPGLSGAFSAAQERAEAHIDPHSSWLHNSLRGGAALGLAVLVADLSGVQHAFWVAFGTLSVLRSSALNTGQNTLRALVGTTVGFVIGGVIVFLIGTSTPVLWVLLPIAVLCAGLAPAAVSFAAGQAAFTVTLLILFNILAPAGWKIGLVRVEDIAIGGAVSLAVGLLFWPRGAAVALGKALEQAYRDSVDYLAATVAYGVGRCDASVPGRSEPREEATRAAAASRRLDDTFRGYLSERGAKPLPLADVTGLVNGVAGLRLAADGVLTLWREDGSEGGDRAAARRELLSSAGLVSIWYVGFGASLSGRASVPEPLALDEGADDRLIEAVGRDLRNDDGEATATAVRVIWTGDHLDAARRLQDSLVGPARAAVDSHALS